MNGLPEGLVTLADHAQHAQKQRVVAGEAAQAHEGGRHRGDLRQVASRLAGANLAAEERLLCAVGVLLPVVSGKVLGVGGEAVERVALWLPPALGALATMQFLVSPNAAYRPRDDRDDPEVMAAWNAMNNERSAEARQAAFERWLATRLETSGQQQASWRVDPKRAGGSGCGGACSCRAASTSPSAAAGWSPTAR